MISGSFFIETFGCQMNLGDSDLMRLSLEGQGFQPATDPMDAEFYIFNTCSVRENAEKKATARIREARGVNRKRKIIVCGCMAQRLGQQLVDKKYADLVLGPYQSPQIGAILQANRKLRGVFTSQDALDLSPRIDNALLTQKEKDFWHKWVSITHGCENFCTYCIVPHVRGPLHSLPSKTIFEFVRQLPDHGVSEITLLGQNVNQYGQDNGDIPFSQLLDQCAAVPGLRRISFMTSHPRDFSDDLIEVIASRENIARAVHLPLQSGSDRVLQLMNRGYTMRHYMAVVEKLLKLMPGLGLSTDLIAGFPGETEDDFQATLQALHDIPYDDAFLYGYSPRSGTPACDLPDQLTNVERGRRLQTMIDTFRPLRAERLRRMIGKTDLLTVECFSKRTDNEVMGHSMHAHSIVIEGGAEDIGRMIPVVISDLRGTTLYGTRV